MGRSIANLLAALSGLLLSLLLAELGLRILGIGYPSFYTHDRNLGVALRPGAHGWSWGEGRAFVEINSAGMRDEERPRSKPAGTYRIAVLGDSYALAKQVDIAETFWRVLESELGSCPALGGRRVDAMNFGVSGYGTAQQLVMLRERVWQFEPDLVLLAFLTGNDLTDNSPDLGRDRPRPFFRLDDGDLILDESFRDSTAYRSRASWYGRVGYVLVTHSRVAQVLNEGKNTLRRLALMRRTRDAGQEEDQAGLDVHVYSPPGTRDWHRAWRLTEELMRAMHQEVQAGGARFAVVVLSNGIQVHPDPEVRNLFEERHGIADLFYPDRRVERFGKASGFPVLTLAPRLQSWAEDHQAFLHGFPETTLGTGHWNPTGHRVAGTFIAGFLCDLLVRDPPDGLRAASDSAPSRMHETVDDRSSYR